MAFCTKCGVELKDGSSFCHACGAKIGYETHKKDFTSYVNQFTGTTDTTEKYDQIDIAQNKAVSVIAYISWLVLIPLLKAKSSPFARFHTNQGLVLWLLSIGWSIARGVISFVLLSASPYLEPVVSLLGVVNILFLVLMVVGIVNAAQGKAKELPIIGKIKLTQTVW